MMEDLYTGTPLKGLRSFSELSGEERDTFFTRFPDAKKLSTSALEKAYKNRQFLDRFNNDKELFNSLSYDDRNAMYKQAIVNDAFTQRFGSGDDLSSELRNIHSADAQLHLLENGYKTIGERDAEKEETAEAIKQTALATPGQGQAAALFSNLTAGVISKKKKRDDAALLEEANIKENDSVKASAAGLKDYLDAFNVQQFKTNQNYSYEVEQQFEQLMNQKTEAGAPLFPYWDAYKDSYQLSDWTPEKKANTLAQFNAILAFAEGRPEEEKADLYERAIDVVNKDFQHEIHEDTTFLDKYANTEKAIMTKAVASIAQTMLGTYALTQGIRDTFDGGNRLQNYLAGKNNKGEDLSSFLTMEYYANMDAFNTWSPKEQELIKQRGGVSTSLNVKDVGEEYKWFTTESLLEARAMLGYQASSLAIDYLTLGSGKALKAAGRAGAGALKALGTSMRDIAKIHQIIDNPVTEALGTLARSQIHAVSESVLEGMGVYDEIMAEQQALKDADYNSPETQELLRQRVEERFNQKAADAQNLQLILDTEGKGTSAISTTNYSELYEQAKQEVLNEWNAQKEDAIEKAATSGFILEATTKQLKNSIGDAAFKQYMYAKPLRFNTRNRMFHSSDVELLEDGTLAAKKLRAVDYTKKALKTIAGGGFDEYTDEWLNQGALAFGLNRANDYIQQSTDPDATAFTSSWYGDLESYMSGVGDAVFDPSSFQQMFVGAISPVTNISINPAGVARLASKGRKAWENLSTAEIVNELVTNPVYTEAIGSYQEYKDLKERLEATNSIIKSHGEDFKSIIPSILNLKGYLEAQTSRDTQEQKDNLSNLGFQTIKYLEELSTTAEVSPLYNDYMQKLEAAANGDISNEDVQAYLNANGNKEIIATLGQEEANTVAAEAIKDNATKLLDEIKVYKDTKTLIQDYYGRDIPQDAQDELIFLAIKENDWKERIAQMEQKLTGGKGTRGNLLGDRAKAYIKNINESIDNQISSLQGVIDAQKEALKDAKDSAQINIYKKTIDSATNKIAELNKQKKEANEYSYKVLTADEIINSTTPIERAILLTKPSYFSKEQQLEIEKAKNSLSKIDPEYIEHAVDVASLQQRLDNSEGSFRAILEDVPSWMAYNFAAKQANYAKSVTRNIQAQAENLYMALENNPDTDAVMSSIIGRSSAGAVLDAIDRVIDAHPEYEERISGYKDVAQYKQDAVNIISNFDIPQDQKNILAANIASIISNAKTKDEAIEAIESVLDSDAVTDRDKEVLNTIASKLEEVGYQRDATRVRNRAEERRRRIAAEQAAKAAEEAKKGSNFNWSGFNAGSRIYSVTDKGQVRDGYVVGFDRADNGDGLIKVRWKTSKGNREPLSVYNATTDKSKLYKSVPLQEEVERVTSQTTTPTTTPTNLQDVNLDETAPVAPISAVAEEPTAQAEPESIALTDVAPEEAANTSISNSFDLQGNGYYRYEEGKTQKKRVGTYENDAYSQVFSWFDDHGIELQEIVDNELGLILQRFPNTQIHWMRKKVEGAQNADKVAQTLFNVIEFTPEIQKSGIHKDSRGGVIEFNGKQWLIVGTTLYNSKESSPEVIENFKNNRDRTDSLRSTYFSTHPEELYWVDEDAYSVVTDFRAGNITKQLLNDESSQVRSLGELLYNADGTINAERNPFGLTWEDLSFGIVVGGSLKPINIPERLIPYTHTPRRGAALDGSVYIMVPGAGQDRLIPVMINPSKVEELKDDSALKNEIYQNFMGLISPDYNIRESARNNLWTLIDIGTERPDTILIGNSDKQVLTFVKNGVKVATFDLTKPVDKAEYVRALADFNPRVNLTPSVLRNSTRLNMYSEAGALNTDVAKLGLSNASYTIAKVDPETGDPILDGPIVKKPAPKPSERTDLGDRNPIIPAVPMNNTYYRFRNGKWYTATDEEVTNPITIASLSYNQLINEQEMKPLDLDYTKSEFNYYAISSNPESPLVVKVHKKTKEASPLSTTRSSTILNKAKEVAEQKAREQAAKEALKKDNLKDVDLGLDEAVDEIIQQPPVSQPEDVTSSVSAEMIGEPITPTVPTVSEEKPITQAPISESVAETKYDITDRSKKAAKNLQGSSNFITFDSIFNNDSQLEELFNVAAEKLGWSEDITKDQMEKSLQDNNIPITGISDFNIWLDIIKNCR